MYSVSINKKALKVEKTEKGFTVDGVFLNLDQLQISENQFHILPKGKSISVELIHIQADTKTVLVKLDNKIAEVRLKDKFDLLLEKLGMNGSSTVQIKVLKAPMPGLIFEIKVKEGDEVKKGDPILILEAMKMENLLKSPGEGVVKEIKIKKGESVEKNQVLIRF